MEDYNYENYVLWAKTLHLSTKISFGELFYVEIWFSPSPSDDDYSPLLSRDVVVDCVLSVVDCCIFVSYFVINHPRSTFLVSGLTLEPTIRIIEAIITLIATA